MRRLVLRILKWTVLVSLAVLALLYAGDFLSVHYRMRHPKPNDPFEAVTSYRVLAIPLNSGKLDFEIDAQNPQQTQVCTHSLFPQAGHKPCWYVKRHANDPIPMVLF